MQQLIEYIVKGLVEFPDDVEVQAVEDGDVDVFEISVADDDLGRVIGRHGRTANAIRAVVGAASSKQGRRSQVEILD